MPYFWNVEGAARENQRGERLQGVIWEGTLVSAGIPMSTRITIFALPGPQPSSGVTVRFGTLLHRQLYPKAEQIYAESAPLFSLSRICFLLAIKLRCEGFVVSPNDEDELCVASATKICAGILEPDLFIEEEVPPFGEMLLAGIDSNRVKIEEVKKSWGGNEKTVAIAMGKFVVLNLGLKGEGN